MKNFYILSIVFLFFALNSNSQTLLYFNDFESDGVGDATIVGSGEVVADEAVSFGNVFHNAAGGQAIRTNYLLLPNTVFADLQASGKKELTIAFWVNKGTAENYEWTPIFSSYGAAPVDGKNTFPMMILQSRLIAQVNIAGWSNFESQENDAGENLIDHTWLDDGEWHYYSATFTETAAKIYVDGILKNSWTFTGEGDNQVIGGMFSNGSELTYICLGGNQAWEWGDEDPAYKFDDVAIYSDALTVEQIQANIDAKLNSTSIGSIVSDLNKEVVRVEYFNISGASVGSNFNALQPGVYIKKENYNNQTSQSFKVVKSR